MKYKSVIDISSFIWNPEDYDQNTPEYFKLKASVAGLIQVFKTEKPFIILRPELLLELINGFPYNKMPKTFREFGNIVYEFLSNIPIANRIGFDIQNTNISSVPSILKPYFNNSTQLEASYLITYLHTNRDVPNVYFTFQYLYGAAGNDLTTYPNEAEHATLKTETILADDSVKLKAFFRRYKRIFEHSSKHHAGREPGDYASPLSCYKDNDSSVAQKYLDEAVLEGSRYYNFDIENNVYIVFFSTGGNPANGDIYHAHDEHNRTNIPPAIRKRFNK